MIKLSIYIIYYQQEFYVSILLFTPIISIPISVVSVKDHPKA